MGRLASLIALCIVVGGCGGEIVAGGPTGTQSPPSTGHRPQGPPDAYLTVHGVRTPMAMGTYCWMTMNSDGTGVSQCVDMVGWDARDDLPAVSGTTGDQVTLELGFDPTKAVEVSVGGHRLRLPAKRVNTFELPGTGLIDVFAYADQGDASYAATAAGG
jgi:hypothetical protein